MTRGVRQIVRFNWPFYALAGAALAHHPVRARLRPAEADMTIEAGS